MVFRKVTPLGFVRCRPRLIKPEFVPAAPSSRAGLASPIRGLPNMSFKEIWGELEIWKASRDQYATTMGRDYVTEAETFIKNTRKPPEREAND